jgi:hypothetical protein
MADAQEDKQEQSMKERLQDTSSDCLKKLEAWEADKKSSSIREDLQEAVHELRKVASRVEIEIAISERGNMSDKPLPIPSHRSTTKAKGAVESILPDNGNTSGNGGGEKKTNNRRPRGRRPAPKKQD